MAYRSFARSSSLFIIAICAVLLLGTAQTFAQTVTIPAANTNTGTARQPLATYFGFQRSAAIYTAAEHGLTAGTQINQVCWYVNSLSAPGSAPMTISMKTTTATNFPATTTVATELTGSTTVYNGVVGTLTAGQFNCYTLTTPFTYTANNIEIIVQTNATGGGNEGVASKVIRYGPSVTNGHQVWEADTTAPAGNGTRNPNRPNIQLVYTIPSGPGTVEFSSATYAGNEGTSALVTVNRVGGFDGAISVNYATSDGTATGADYTPASGTLNWADGDSAAKTFNVSLTPDAVNDPAETVNLTLSTAVGTTITGTNPTVLTITDIPPPLSGTYTVGSGGSFSSLTNAGGIFAEINSAGASGPITIEIVSDLIGETGTNALNAIAGSPLITIKPSGELRTISSTTTATRLIELNGADNITIDGSLAGGTDRNLVLFLNNSTTSGSAVVILRSLGANAGATGNTIKNAIIQNGSSFNTSSTLFNFGIYAGGATANGPDNDNLTIQNNLIQRCNIGMQIIGATTGLLDSLVISDNTIGGLAGTDAIGSIGMNVGQSTGAIVTRNFVTNINNNQAININGIVLSTGSINANVTRNNVSNMSNTNAGGYGSTGIVISTGTATSNLIVANNLVSDIKGTGDSGTNVAFSPVGIRVTGTNTGGINVYYNSVNMFGAFAGYSTGARFTAAFMVNGTGHTNLDIRNNNFVNTVEPRTGTANASDRNFAIYTTTSNTMFSNIDNNNYYVSGTQGILGVINVINRLTLADIQTGTGQDLASISVDPGFVSPTDLHISPLSPVVDMGVMIPGVIDDFDGHIRGGGGARGLGTTDIGADETLAPTAAAAALGGRISAPNGNGIANVKVTVSGGNIDGSLTMTTGPFGYYNFNGLEAGQTYIVMVNSKIYLFAKPVRAVTLGDTITDLDFIAEP